MSELNIEQNMDCLMRSGAKVLSAMIARNDTEAVILEYAEENFTIVVAAGKDGEKLRVWFRNKNKERRKIAKRHAEKFSGNFQA